MKKQGRATQAGGILLVASIFAGVAIGIAKGQSSIGFLAGTGIGIVLALLFWLIERRR